MCFGLNSELLTIPTPLPPYIHNRGWEKVSLPHLTKEEKKKLISSYLSYHGKKLPKRVEEKLEGEEGERTVLFVMTILEELIASSTYEVIYSLNSFYIFILIRFPFWHRPLKKILIGISQLHLLLMFSLWS